MKLLDIFRGAIIGSVAQWPALSAEVQTKIKLPRDMNIIMERDGVQRLTSVFNTIGYKVVETMDQGQTERFTRLRHETEPKEVTFTFLGPDWTIHEYINSEVHSGLMNAISKPRIFRVIQH